MAISDSVSNWKASGIKTVWLKIPSSYGQCIEGAARLGFQFHNAEGTECLMKLWLDKDRPDPTPIFATHQLGVCGNIHDHNSWIKDTCLCGCQEASCGFHDVSSGFEEVSCCCQDVTCCF